jgi:small subunit ribosomal protein YMR-31
MLDDLVPPSEPRVHPASPTGQLPSSFQAYRAKAIQHGPLATGKHAEAARGLVPARSQLESRYRYMAMSAEEMEAVETGGATLFA